MKGIRSYEMNFATLDRCFKELWSVAGLSADFFKNEIHVERFRGIAKTAYEEINSHRIYS